MDRLRADVRIRRVRSRCIPNSEQEYAANAAKISGPFGKLEEALAKRGNPGPYFNGPKLSLVDAAYAPFLQRYTFMDRLKSVGVIDKFPLLAAWRDALIAAPAVKCIDRRQLRGRVAGEPDRAEALAL